MTVRIIFTVTRTVTHEKNIVTATAEKGTSMKNEIQKQNDQGMSEEARELRKAYNREWARKNRERRNALNRAYWERKVARLAESEGTKV